jgi:hypothetical protein
MIEPQRSDELKMFSARRKRMLDEAARPVWLSRGGYEILGMVAKNFESALDDRHGCEYQFLLMIRSYAV